MFRSSSLLCRRWLLQLSGLHHEAQSQRTNSNVLHNAHRTNLCRPLDTLAVFNECIEVLHEVGSFMP